MQRISRENNKLAKVIHTSVWILYTGTVYSVKVSTSGSKQREINSDKIKAKQTVQTVQQTT
jgi:hypothetical protein